MLCLLSPQMEVGGQHLPLYLLKIPISGTSILWNIQGGELFRVPSLWQSMCQCITSLVSLPMSTMHVITPSEYTLRGPLSPCWLILNIRNGTGKLLSSAHIKSGMKQPLWPNLKSHWLIVSQQNQKRRTINVVFPAWPWTWGLPSFNAFGTQLIILLLWCIYITVCAVIYDR